MKNKFNNTSPVKLPPSALSESVILIETLAWLFIATLSYSLVRLEYIIWNWRVWFQNIDLSKITSAVLSGIRFDLSSLTWLSSLILINALIPWPQVSLKLKERTLKTAFALIHTPFLFINMVDMEFIHFSGRRMTPDSFYLLHESHGKLGGMMQAYGLIISFNIFLLIIFAIIILKNPNTLCHKISNAVDPYFKNWKLRIPITLFLLITFVIAARGGLQPKPLEMAHAMAISPDHRITNLSLNSSFTMIHSLQKKRLQRLNYFNSEEDYTSLLNSNTPGELVWPWDQKPKNVVLFILESFGKEYTNLDGKNKSSFTPFLDSLRAKSISFNNSFANGRRSIEALPSLFAGIPSLMDEPFLTSSFQSNSIPRLGSDLEQHGVWTGFFHGGANGTMFFQEFTQRIGFTHYFGKSEYPKPEKDDDGSWGIWDGPYLKYFGNSLREIKSPFFASLFTLSSHHPFNVPDLYKEQLPKGPIPILQSIAYTDLMLQEFFTQFQNDQWFKETLFIITADHTSKSYRPEYQTPDGSFRVPLLLYFPGAKFNHNAKKIDLEEPVQHIDILPTIYDIFAIPQSQTRLARSLLKTGPRKVNVYLDGQQILIEKSGQLLLPTEGDNSQELNSNLQKDWNAHRQEYVNKLIENRL